MSIKVKLNNSTENLEYIHNKMFCPDSLISVGDKSIIIYGMGNPHHYVKLREQFPNLDIYGIEDVKLKGTLRYCQNELGCNIEYYKNENDIDEWVNCIKTHIMKSNKMKFDIGVANPPYGGDGAGKNKKLHFDIMKICLSVCDKVNFIMPTKCLYDVSLSAEREMLKQNGCYNIEIQDKSIFPNTQMPETAIYFCNKSCNQYCERLGEDIYIANNFFKNDIEKYIYNIFNTGNTMYKHTVRIDGEVKREDKIFNNICKKLNRYNYFINISYANHGMTGEWIAQNNLKGVGVKNIDEEIEFILNIKTSKFVMCLQTEQSAQNIYNLLQTKLMRFCLWLLQDDRNMKQKVYQLFPEVDYDNIYDERDLLRAINCDESKIDDILNYVETFDFTEKRNDRFLKRK